MVSSKKIFTVVEVWRGIASEVHAFSQREDAEKCYSRLIAEANRQDDDVQLFEAIIR